MLTFSSPLILAAGVPRSNPDSWYRFWELVILGPLGTWSRVIPLTVVATIGSVLIIGFVLIAVAVLLVHEAIPRTVPVLRVGHCPDGSVFPATSLTSLQNMSSFVDLLAEVLCPLDRHRGLGANRALRQVVSVSRWKLDL